MMANQLKFAGMDKQVVVVNRKRVTYPADNYNDVMWTKVLSEKPQEDAQLEAIMSSLKHAKKDVPQHQDSFTLNRSNTSKESFGSKNNSSLENAQLEEVRQLL